MARNRSKALADILTNRMKQGWPLGGFFPSVRDLSEEYQASPVTVLASMRLLAERGLARKRAATGRYAVTDRVRTERRESPSSPRIADLLQSLRTDLLSGRFSRMTEMPSLKELRAHYACGYRAIHAALTSLAAQGILKRQGRGFSAVVPHRTTGGRSRRSVWLSGLTDFPGGHGTMFSPVVAAIEWELSSAGMGPLRTVVTDSSQEVVSPPDRLVAGYIYFHDTRGGAKWNWWTVLREKAEVHGIPVAIGNLADVTLDHPNWSRSASVCGISPDNLQGGRDMGMLLDTLGHRRIVFISHVMFREPGAYNYPVERRQYPLWARHRFLGLTEIFPVSQNDVYGTRWLDASANTIPDVASPRYDEIAVSLRKTWGTFKGRFGVDSVRLKEGLDPAFRLLDNCRTADRLRPVFEDALEDSRCTAWVCVNDELAMHAGAFLRRRGVRVPEDLSLVGFDNAFSSYSHDLATWEPNLAGIGHLLVRFLRYPHLVGTDSLRRAWVPGRIIQRSSVGPARRTTVPKRTAVE